MLFMCACSSQKIPFKCARCRHLIILKLHYRLICVTYTSIPVEPICPACASTFNQLGDTFYLCYPSLCLRQQSFDSWSKQFKAASDYVRSTKLLSESKGSRQQLSPSVTFCCCWADSLHCSVWETDTHTHTHTMLGCFAGKHVSLC